MGNSLTKKEKASQQFAEVYNRESDAVFRFCLFRTSDRDMALDFTQDTFMRFWNSLQKDRKIDNHRTFLFTIARNTIIDWYRKKKAVSLDAILEEVGADRSIFTAVARENVETEFEAQHLLEKISSLVEPYQHAVYLRCVEELKPRQIAEILGESANVISVRISRGLSQLRAMLQIKDEKAS
ncbi:MAG: RNA polymerase sigma factor [bacterium]|nr:RNA polymerase sigma factor [bacterium]